MPQNGKSGSWKFTKTPPRQLQLATQSYPNFAKASLFDKPGLKQLINLVSQGWPRRLTITVETPQYPAIGLVQTRNWTRHCIPP
jgi:hypothetical protein